ncbi:Swt1 family HEPN domain-containing protein [uncultured Parasphingorhabdus sp.]|uniref:Swt1 family HEPN domain-containing protein n=1 Tax=uncultured Parasphingorhabdus sp. TaxID=2709694 RepID=UPI002AA7204B|nr:Swt1 family HEPN domain-containing protein [uncultured Parasphingorhabdus sp.]
MKNDEQLELFFLKVASMQLAVEESMPSKPIASAADLNDKQLRASVSQFSSSLRDSAESMAEFYKLFYMLENDMRKLINDTLSDSFEENWWDDHAPPNVQEEVRLNQKRELEFGVTSRSDDNLDYTTFGQLGDIIRHNWDLFGGIISNQKALGRVMSSLNNLRGPIAHCGVLADDEIDRLKLTVKDWFRLLEGPKS